MWSLSCAAPATMDIMGRRRDTAASRSSPTAITYYGFRVLILGVYDLNIRGLGFADGNHQVDQGGL